MERLAREGQLVAYKHDGFFFAMDTYREYQYLNEIWSEGKAPWRLGLTQSGTKMPRSPALAADLRSCDLSAVDRTPATDCPGTTLSPSCRRRHLANRGDLRAGRTVYGSIIQPCGG